METLELVKLLNQQANEIASEGHNGWGNTMREAADKLEELQERIYQDPVECSQDISYLIARLERVIELINKGATHMAVAKLLADISALRAMPPK